MKMCVFLLVVALCAWAPTPAESFGPNSAGCEGQATKPCLPGFENVGVGFDLARGKSTGRLIYNKTFAQQASKVYVDPFGNNSRYVYPDQMTVQRATQQTVEHHIFRSLDKFASHKTQEAHAEAHGWGFKASTDYKAAQDKMSDNLHIVTESTCRLDLYKATLDPPLSFIDSLDSIFQKYIDQLPDEYDSRRYQQIIQYYGTHYVDSVSLGGRAKMSTTISKSFYSYQSDSSISASLSAQWFGIGGSASGGSSSHALTQSWKENADYTTVADGGDPSINSFANSDEWSKWARSVETGSPIVTTYTLTPLSDLIADQVKQANFDRAVQEYGAQYNVTAPPADLTQVRMNWCDCKRAAFPQERGCNVMGSAYSCPMSCPQGYTLTGMTFSPLDDHWGFGMTLVPKQNGDGYGVTCCRPCFTAQN